MKNSLKIIKFVVMSAFMKTAYIIIGVLITSWLLLYMVMSEFMKTAYIIIGVLITSWLLLTPTIMMLELYERTPVLELLLSGPIKTTEPRMIDTVKEDGTIIKGSYKDVFNASMEKWWYIPVLGVINIILMIIVLSPLIILLMVILLLYGIYQGIIRIYQGIIRIYQGIIRIYYFFKNLPKNLREYKDVLEKRINEK